MAESVPALLHRLGLGEWADTFEEEVAFVAIPATAPPPLLPLLAVTSLLQHAKSVCRLFPRAAHVLQAITEVSLLTSMGADMLHENLEELGLGDIAISKLRAALFPEANDNDDDDDDGLQLEENANEKVVEKAVPSGSPPTPPVAPAAPAAPLPANFPAAPPADVLPNDLTQEEIDAAEVGCGCG